MCTVYYILVGQFGMCSQADLFGNGPTCLTHHGGPTVGQYRKKVLFLKSVVKTVILKELTVILMLCRIFFYILEYIFVHQGACLDLAVLPYTFIPGIA